MADIRLNKLMRQYQVGMDTIVNCLESAGVIVEKNPNTKISSDLLPLLEERLNQDKDQQNQSIVQPKKETEPTADPPAKKRKTHTIDPSLPADIKKLATEMSTSHDELLKLVKEMRIGKASAPYLDKNKRLLSKLVNIALEHNEFNDAIRTYIDSLSRELFDMIIDLRAPGKHKKANRMKADYIITIRNRYLKALEETIPDEILDIFEVGWDKITFQDSRLLLDTGQERRLACPLSQSRQTYNLFREAFIQRVPPLQVRIHSKQAPEIIKTPEFQEVFQYLQIREDIRLGEFSRRLDLAKFLVKSKINFQDTFLPKDRGPYIQFLVEKQSPDHRFIPVFEKAIDREDAFLFTLKGSRTYIVWENMNENTATYVFPVSKQDYENTLQAIYDYASSDTDYKRMRMHYGQSVDILGTQCRILYHNDLDQWKRDVSLLLI